MNRFEQKVYNFIQSEQLIEGDDRIVLGVSGGADSVCLLCVLIELAGACKLAPGGLFVVHVHHMLRGEEADRDAAFTKALCEQFGVGYREYKKDIRAYAKENGMSLEEAGRTYRYQCFTEAAKELRFSKIAVAHNQDDMAETVLFHIMRGSGLKGLAGISAKRDNIIRPLLAVSRREIEAYLAERQQRYCQDSTNDSLAYTRNKIRHVILPCMREINEQAVDHICQVAKDAEGSYQYIHEQAASQCEAYEEDAFGRRITLSVAELYKSGPILQEHIVWEAICQIAQKNQDIARKHVQAVVSLLYQDTGSLVQLPYGIVARRNYGELILSNKTETAKDYCIRIDGSGVYEILDMGKLSVTVMPYTDVCAIPKKDYTKLFDYDKIKGNLCIRTPENDDYIVIDTAGNTKKLSRVFIDAKTDRMQRADWPVLACGREIIWVLGLRFSPAYYVGPETKTVMYINYEKKGEWHGTEDRSVD